METAFGWSVNGSQMNACVVCQGAGYLLSDTCPLCDGQPLADDESLVFDPVRPGGLNRGPVYCRSFSTGREQLEKALLNLYHRDVDTHGCIIMPSGMAAISAVMYVHAAPRGKASVIVHGDELYCDVRRTVEHLVDVHAPLLTSCAVDIRDAGAIRSLFAEYGDNICIFHFEVCTNPSGQFFDFTLIDELRTLSPDCLFVADNTWLSGVLFNPLDHGADLVVESLTKYVSAGTCIGGTVIGRNDCVAKVLTFVKVFGIFIGNDHCEMFLHSLNSVASRVSVASANAMIVACHLEGHKAVTRVMYPLLPSHPTHRLAEKYLCSGGPGCVWLHIKASKKKVMASLGSFEWKTSFGGSASRIDPWPIAASHDAYEFPRPVRTEQTAGGIWLRLALGYQEDAANVITKLDSLLEAAIAT